MGQILLAYGLPKETVAPIMMLYKNTKKFAHRMETDFFDIVAGVLQGDTLVLYMFIIGPYYVFRTSIDLTKENGFTLKKARS